MYTARLQRRFVKHAQHITKQLQLLGARSVRQQRFSTKPVLNSSVSTTPQFERIDHSYLVEEEMLPNYKPEEYYPVKLGEILHDRYKTIGKLGYGTKSTVWLCRDLQKVHDYVAVKICISHTFTLRERDIYKEISGLQTSHGGQNNVRKMYDRFAIQGPHGFHICLVLQPLGISLGEFKQLSPEGLFDSEVVQALMRCVLFGLDYLHREAEVIHTGRLTQLHQPYT